MLKLFPRSVYILRVCFKMPVEIERVFPRTIALSVNPEFYRYRLDYMTMSYMTMNLTQMTTLVALSACVIAEGTTAATANVISTNVISTLEPAVEMQATDAIVQLENAVIQSIAQPETLSQNPEVLPFVANKASLVVCT